MGKKSVFRKVLFALLIVAFAVGMFIVGHEVLGPILQKYKKGETKADVESVERVKIGNVLDDTIAFYFNLGQLVDKSGIDSILTDANRALIASMAAPEDTAYAQSLLQDLDNTGINTSKPIYGYANFTSIVDEQFAMTLVAQVKDAKMVDRFIDFLSETSGDTIYVERDGDMRLINISDGLIGYNSKRFIVVTGICDDYSELLDAAFQRPLADLSAYAKYDAALSMQIMPFIDIIRNELQLSIDRYVADIADLEEYGDDDWELEWIKEELAEAEQNLETLNNAEAYFSQNASALIGLAFENGKVVLETCYDGIEDEFNIARKVNNNYLNYVDNSALVLFNFGLDGKKFANLLTQYIPSDLADLIGIDRNEFNLYMGIGCDAIKSINGDVAIALNDISGDRYDSVQGVEALVSIDVNDDYIFSNVAQFGADMLNQVNDNLYSLSFYGFNFYLGQQNDTLFATVNMEYKERLESAANARWADDVKDSYGYILIDLDNVVANDFVYYNCCKAFDMNTASFKNIVKSLSHVYFSATSANSVEFVIAFDDENTNSLENIVRQVSSIAVSEMTQQMLR